MSGVVVFVAAEGLGQHDDALRDVGLLLLLLLQMLLLGNSIARVIKQHDSISRFHRNNSVTRHVRLQQIQLLQQLEHVVIAAAANDGESVQLFETGTQIIT